MLTAKTKTKKGFTLLELLIVISIIGILSSVVLVSLSGARAKARDAKRISDLHQIKLALELYYSDNGNYPPSPCGWDCNGYYYSNDSSWGTLQAYLSPYMPTLPRDPLNTPASCGGPWGVPCYTYSYGNVTGTNYPPPQYDLTTQLEDPSHPLRTAVRNYYFYFNPRYLWNSYHGQIYEASPY